MGIPRLAELASEALIEDISDSGSGRFEHEPHDAEEECRRRNRAHRRHQQRRGEDVVELRLAERFEQQGRARDEERQGAEYGAGVLAQDVPPADEHAHQDDEPDDEEAGQYP